MTTDRYVLDEETARFITHHVSINVASANRQCHPSLGRAYGCRVSSDRTCISVLLLSTHYPELIADLQSTGRIAVVVSQPSTHRTIQFKADKVELTALQDEDRELMQRYLLSLSEELTPLGFSHDFVQAIKPDLYSNGVCATFSPNNAFIATPGPHAGKKLE